MTVIYEIQRETTAASLMLVDGVTSGDLVELLGTFRPLGLWRLDLKTGLAYWTRDVFEIYGMPYRDEPVNFAEMNSKFHPDDLAIRLELIERAVRLKKPFHYVLRITNGDSGYKFVRVIGRYRETDDGFGEFIGASHVVDAAPCPSSRFS
jgi:hypothetical protein